MPPTIRAATAADLLKFFGRLPGISIRAWVADLDGKIIGIIGVMLPKDAPVIYFSDATPELLRHHRKTIVRGVRLMLEAVGRRRGIALQGGEAHVLEHFGFHLDAEGIWTMGCDNG